MRAWSISAPGLDHLNVRPVVDRTFRFDDARAALEYLQKGSHFGKIVLSV